MDAVTQYSINIAVEAVMILLLLVLLITCHLQRRIFPTTIPLIFLLSFIILLLINQIIMWSILIHGIPGEYGIVLARILSLIDYIFAYCTSVAFFFYVEALAREGYKQNGVKYTSKKILRIAIITWGVVSTIVYAVLINVPTIYYIENETVVFSVEEYVWVHIIAKFTLFCTLFFVIYHRKFIGKQEIALSIVFIIFVSALIVVDEICGLCISYILISVFTFILYVRIDLNKGFLLERQEREITQWKTQIMLSQMQPHFLYNVLTTISGMCETENALQARDVVNRFADYFRTNLQSLREEKTISFEKELEHIKTYLWLEKIRFEDALNIRYEIETMDFSVPSLAIQPMVENAVKHGILPKEDGGNITIKTHEGPLDYVIVIEDDGVGFDVNQKRDVLSHVGIDNVSKRLAIICNGTCTIQSEKGKGTVVTIHIPK